MSQKSSDVTPERRSRWRTAGIVLAYALWVGVAFFAAQYLVAYLAKLLLMIGVPLLALNDAALQTMLAAVAYSLALALIIGLPRIVLHQVTTRQQLGLDRLVNFSDIGLALAGVVPYLLLSFVLGWLAALVIPHFQADQAQNIGFDHLVGQSEYVLAFVALVVVAPLAEEIIFRGYLYGKLKSRTKNIIVATLVTSLTFAILHLQLNVGIDVFALSIVLCLLRETTGSIWAGVLLHMLKNGLAFYLLFVNPSLIQ